MKHAVVPSDVDDVTAAMRDARRNVSIAKIAALEIESGVLGSMAGRNPHRKQEIVDCLHDIALANDLTTIHGQDLIDDLISAAMSGAA